METAADRVQLELTASEAELIEDALMLAGGEDFVLNAAAHAALCTRMQGQQEAIRDLIERVRAAGHADVVEVASEDSFPASDPPGWSAVSHVGPSANTRAGRRP